MRQKYTLLLLALPFTVGCASSTPGWLGDPDAGHSVTPTDDGGKPATPDAGAAHDAATPSADASADASTPLPDGATTTNVVPNGWLYTQGNQILLSNGTTGTPWIGRGVNVDDLFLCGYNGSAWMTNAESTLTTLVSNLLSTWKPNFVRVSLGMNSYSQASWTGGNAATYKTPMTNVINTLGATPGTYVLVTLRSDATMTSYSSDDATFVPTAATDAVYSALVDSFAHASFVAFGVSNEPGGNALSSSTIRSAMDHAVSVIRAEEDKLGVPHHLVSVQGNDWTSDISIYASQPLAYDNVVYEVHGYPPPASSYTYSNLPVIVGEYGSLSNANAFYADVESKQISTLAWDFDSFSNCAPDLLTVNQSSTNLVPTSWGSTVQGYLLSH